MAQNPQKAPDRTRFCFTRHAKCIIIRYYAFTAIKSVLRYYFMVRCVTINGNWTLNQLGKEDLKIFTSYTLTID